MSRSIALAIDRMTRPTFEEASNFIRPMTIAPRIRSVRRCFSLALREGIIGLVPLRRTGRPRAQWPDGWMPPNRAGCFHALLTDKGRRTLTGRLPAACTGLPVGQPLQPQPA